MTLLAIPSNRRRASARLGALCCGLWWALAASAAGAQTTARQRAAIEAAFARADLNADGRLSREEAQRFPEIAARFDALDTNRDGYLSLEEFSIGAVAPRES